MRNMAYCRFENTLASLEECQDFFSGVQSVDEAQAAVDLYRLCATIVESVNLLELEERLETLTRQQPDE